MAFRMSTDKRTGHGSPPAQGGTERRRRGHRWRRSVWDGEGPSAESHNLPHGRGLGDLNGCQPGGSCEQQDDAGVSLSAEIDRDPKRMTARLLGMAIPEIWLESCRDGTVDLASLARECLAIYLYPGNAGFPSDWERSVAVDAALHRGFRDSAKDLALYRCAVVGVSTQLGWVQFHSFAHGKFDHDLLSDPTLQLAGKLALPTVKVAGRRVYEQQVLIVIGGRIRHIFYPVHTDRCAAQVVAWLKLN